MSEEEIINYFKEVLNWYRKNTPDRVYALNNKDIEMIQGLLDLYQKEKEKNKKINEINFRVNKNLLETAEKLEQEKEKNEELENKRVKPMNNIGILEEFIDKQKSNKGTFVPIDFEITAIENLIQENKELKEKNKELEKYDYRKIKIEEKNKISSIHFTKKQLDLMNLGIALYVGIPNILADTEDEKADI